jgi:hypothetical protein
MDPEGVLFISGVEIFAFPLTAGSLLAWRGRKLGLPLLKFGSLLVLPADLSVFVELWCLERDPDYHQYLRYKGIGRP